MKAGIVTSLMLFALVSCHDEAVPSIPESRPLRATYTSTETGNKTAQETFEYNENGKITTDIYTDLTGTGYSGVTYYEYDGDGNLVRRKGRSINITMPFEVTEYTYQNGLKTSEKFYSEGGTSYRLTSFIYDDGLLPTGSVTSGQDDFNNRYGGHSTYRYDPQGHLISETKLNETGDVLATYTYTYQGKNLVKSCESYCLSNDYNEDGQIVRSTTISGDLNRLTTEFFYKDKLLDEKWMYGYPAYDLTAGYSYIVKVRYEY